MRIDNIKLQNFKNFGDLAVHFEGGVNLFVGGNGSGKTSLLEAINVAVGCYFGSQVQKMQRVIEFNEIKITHGIRESSATVTGFNSEIGEWKRTIKTSTKKNDSKFIKNISEKGEILFKNLDNGEEGHAPIICYYSTQRLHKDVNQSIKNIYDSKIGRRNGYSECLNEYANKKLLVDWLGKATSNRTTKIYKGIYTGNQILENVEQAILKVIIDFLELDPNEKIGIYQNSEDNNELYIKYGSNHDLPLSYYSDGFRNLIFLILDLVWRASQINPEHTLAHLKMILGVVTIDEIDLHLHPRWQAKAISTLQHFFPNVQFFITTHSPTVVANFEHGTLYVINDNKVEKYEQKYFAKNINYVLETVLGASERHKPTKEKINVLFGLIEDNKLEDYEPLLTELTDLLGAEDFEIMKANALIAMNNYSDTETTI